MQACTLCSWLPTATAAIAAAPQGSTTCGDTQVMYPACTAGSCQLLCMGDAFHAWVVWCAIHGNGTAQWAAIVEQVHEQRHFFQSWSVS